MSSHDGIEEFRQIGRERLENEEIDRKIFNLSKNKLGHLDVQRFVRAIRRTGLDVNDPRLADVQRNLNQCQNFIIENVDDDDVDCGIDFDCFKGNNFSYVL